MSDYVRSAELMNAEDTILVVVDVQEKLLPLVMNSARVTWNIHRLVDGANLIGVPVVAREQLPNGLGATTPPLLDRIGAITEKLAFSCLACAEFRDRLKAVQRRRVLLCGIETHLGIQQSALDLIAEGYRVYLAVDAISSRFQIDHETGVRRIETSGATLTTVESALCECCFESEMNTFCAIRSLISEHAPDD